MTPPTIQPTMGTAAADTPAAVSRPVTAVLLATVAPVASPPAVATATLPVSAAMSPPLAP
jgi:hypothetical protein